MTEESKKELARTFVAEAKVVLVARYQYMSGVVQACESVAVEERDPAAVPYQNGAISFDFAEVYWFTTPDEKVFKCLSCDDETYYWGMELSLDDVESMPPYEAIRVVTTCERFVLTDWGALIPLNEHELVIPRPDAFTLPPDMLA